MSNSLRHLSTSAHSRPSHCNTDSCSCSFAAYDAHMKALKDQAMALAAVNMNAVEARESKSSSKDSKDTGGDKKRKAKESTGVEKLKKANTKGMAKLSTFFQKK